MRLIFLVIVEQVGKWVVCYIVNCINVFKLIVDCLFVLGLLIGGILLIVYKVLVEMYKVGQVSFKYVVIFNMDEYVGLLKEYLESYYSFMYCNFFDYVDILVENINLLNGNVLDIDVECCCYEEKICFYGKIYLFMGGVGNDGYIVFNELVFFLVFCICIKILIYEICVVNFCFFDGDVDLVLKYVLIVGVGILLDVEEVMILVLGYQKVLVLQVVVEGNVNYMWIIICL